jgi:hypothetical protein
LALSVRVVLSIGQGNEFDQRSVFSWSWLLVPARNFAKVFSPTEKITIFAAHFANSYLAIYIRS